MQVFGTEWFSRHQMNILRLANTRYGRRLLRIERDVHPRKCIVGIKPHCFTILEAVEGDRMILTTDFRTHDKFAKRLFHACRPLWWALHCADLALPPRRRAEYGFGFDTLTSYPAAGANSPCDGNVYRFAGGGEAFSTIRAGAGTDYNNTDAAGLIAFLWCAWTLNTYFNLTRGIYLFDTSSLGPVTTISAATLSLCGTTPKYNNIPLSDGEAALAVVSSNPASTETLAASDYGTLGATRLASDYAYASFSTAGYNDIPLDATGLAAISKTGTTKLGTRLAVDADGGSPGWYSDAKAAYYGVFADNPGTASDPKLTVTYSAMIEVNVSEANKRILSVSVNSGGTKKQILGAWMNSGGTKKKIY